ncbi:MAG: hypothetical protein ACLR1V_00055 [Coprococcus sp.]
MVIRNLLTATEDGLGGGETPIFPVQIFKVKGRCGSQSRGVRNHDPFRWPGTSTAQRLFPNYLY